MTGRGQQIGVSALALSTATTAGLGWATLIVVARVSGPDDYAAFAVIWSFFYGVAGLLAGLQQEIVRSSGSTERLHPVAQSTAAVGVVAAGVALVVVTVAAASLGVWGDAYGVTAAVAGALALGLLGLAGLVIVVGLLAASRRWAMMATVLALDSGLRLLGVSLCVAGDAPLWCLTAALGGASWVWLPCLFGMRGVVASARVGVTPTPFALKAATLMASTGLASLLVAGLPWLVVLSQRGDAGNVASGLLAALVLFRSPFIALMNGLRPVVLRSYLGDRDRLGADVRKAWLFYAGVGGVIVVFAWAVGPHSLGLFLGEGFMVTRLEAGLLTASSILLVMGTHGGLALVAADRHARTAEGWGLGVLATIGALALPLEDGVRIVAAAIVGPLCVLIWQDRHLQRELGTDLR